MQDLGGNNEKKNSVSLHNSESSTSVFLRQASCYPPTIIIHPSHFSLVEVRNPQVALKQGGEYEHQWKPWTPRYSGSFDFTHKGAGEINPRLELRP